MSTTRTPADFEVANLGVGTAPSPLRDTPFVG
jgi:hypothetical protein